MIGREKLKLSNTTQISKFEGIFSFYLSRKQLPFPAAVGYGLWNFT